MLNVNGCAQCGRLERGHGIVYSHKVVGRWPWGSRRVLGYHVYQAPTDQERKRRFKLKWRRGA